MSCDSIAECFKDQQFELTEENKIQIKDDYLSLYIRDQLDSSDFSIGLRKITIDPNYVPALVCAALNNPNSAIYDCLDKKIVNMPFWCTLFNNDLLAGNRCCQDAILRWCEKSSVVKRGLNIYFYGELQSDTFIAKEFMNFLNKKLTGSDSNPIKEGIDGYFKVQLEDTKSSLSKSILQIVYWGIMNDTSVGQGFLFKLLELITTNEDVREAIKHVITQRSKVSGIFFSLQPKTVGLTETSLQTTVPPEKDDETPTEEMHEKMEVDSSKQRNVLQIIEETTQSDTVPRPISPSEVPNGPAVDPIDEVRGDRDGEDDPDGLLTFENIHFAYNIYIDMFKEPDSLETFTNYLRRNAKFDRVAEKMVEKYKNKKKSK
nr:VP+ [Scorpion polyomavirus 3]